MNKISPRTTMFIFGGLALLALILLAATVNTLTLDPGQAVPLAEMAPDFAGAEAPEGLQRFLLAVFRAVLVLSWISLPFGIIYLILSKEARKRFLRDVMALLPFLILLLLLSRAQLQPREAQEVDPSIFEMGEIEMGQQPVEPLPEFQPPGEWATTLTTIIIGAALVLVLVGIGLMLYRRSRLSKPTPLDRIRKEAQIALDAIEAGGDLRDVIMRCYAQMIAALKQYRNIQRDQDMTPHEFEDYLAGHGMPRDPVRQLTLLFEQVRYGGQTPGRQDERAAIASLNAIVAACEKSAEAGRAR